ncbi:MAG: hydroxysqualene dehydroxylase HpnE [Pseudomonadota bacterium]
MTPSPVLIVGGGWAGLATASKLQRLGHPVTVIEAAKQWGGRARTTAMGDMQVDNGQHLMLGAYKGMLDLMSAVGIEEHDVFLRTPLDLRVRDLASGGELGLRAPKLPAPLNLLVAFLRCRGIGWSDKLRGLLSMDRMMRTRFKGDDDCDVLTLMKRCGVPENIQQKLQIPLCIAALNTDPEQASGRIFVNVLREAFKTSRAASDFLIPIADLGSLLPEPAAVHLKAQGAELRLDCKAARPIIEDGRVTGVETRDGERLLADHTVVAANYPQARKLLAGHELTQPLGERLANFADEPIYTLYYQFDESVALPDYPMLGLLGGHAQWLFDRRIVGQPGLLAVVISADGPHSQLSRKQLAGEVLDELRRALKPMGVELPEPRDTLVLKEARATYRCTVGVLQQCPENRTDVDGLWLAADYTRTGFPATLEGAVRSGYNCAEMIHALPTQR